MYFPLFIPSVAILMPLVHSRQNSAISYGLSIFLPFLPKEDLSHELETTLHHHPRQF